MIHSFIASGLAPDRLTASLIATAPSFGDDIEDRDPINAPIGVLTADKITDGIMIPLLNR
jgi:hypothetical protein